MGRNQVNTASYCTKKSATFLGENKGLNQSTQQHCLGEHDFGFSQYQSWTLYSSYVDTRSLTLLHQFEFRRFVRSNLWVFIYYVTSAILPAKKTLVSTGSFSILQYATSDHSWFCSVTNKVSWDNYSSVCWKVLFFVDWLLSRCLLYLNIHTARHGG